MMPNYPLSDRQKNLLRSIVPGLKAGTVKTEWIVLYGDNRIMDIFGLDGTGTLWREVWSENLENADFDVFVSCGFFIETRPNTYSLVEQAIIDAVENDFGADTIEVTPEQWGVKPIFGEPQYFQDLPDVFVLMPFRDELKPVYEDHILRVTQHLGLICRRGDDFFRTRAVIDDLWSAIYYSKACIADCTGKNPNVFYELGMAHTLGRPTILITQSIDDIPFDIRHIRHILYQLTPRGMHQFEDDLLKALQSIFGI